MISRLTQKILVIMLFVFVGSVVVAQSNVKYEARLIKKLYSMGTASVNGTYYPLGNAISGIISKELSKMMTVAEPTAGSVANVKYLKKNQINLALMQSDIAWNAFNGYGSFAGNSFKDLRVIASLYSEKIQIVVRADSKIQLLSDLRGKKIAIGDRESGSAAGAIQILSAAGLKHGTDYEIIYEGFLKSTESLVDGDIDAIYYVGAAPADGISRLAAKASVRLIPIPSEVMVKLMKDYPYYSSEEVLANTYTGLKKNINTLGFKALLTCTEEIQEEDVITILSVIYNNPKLTGEKNEVLVEVSPDEGLMGFDQKMLHPGALKYFTQRQQQSRNN